MVRNDLNDKEMVQHKPHQYDPISAGVERLPICKKRFDWSTPARAIPSPEKSMDLTQTSYLNNSEIGRCPTNTSQVIQSNIEDKEMDIALESVLSIFWKKL